VARLHPPALAPLRRPDARPARRPSGQHLTALPTRIGALILAAWNAKEDLLDLLALASTHPDRETVNRLLHRFYTRCAATDLPELHRLATTIETWWPQILAFLHTGITNAGSEGTNRVIKTIARDAYGFRNPDNQRLRTRAATTRRHRGHLHPAQLRRATIFDRAPIRTFLDPRPSSAWFFS
jgi:hypothetical protein